jgi:molybdate transport system regulatory protein
MVTRKQKPALKKPEIRIKVRIGNGAFGPGKVRLLEQIAITGSISSAAKQCGMNYRRAQYLLETLAEALGTTVVETVIGGSQGGGASLTAAGKALIETFHSLETSVEQATRTDLTAMEKTLKQSS